MVELPFHTYLYLFISLIITITMKLSLLSLLFILPAISSILAPPTKFSQWNKYQSTSSSSILDASSMSFSTSSSPTSTVFPHGTPGVQNCTTNYYTQTIDHFSWSSPPAGSYTYQQRYFLNNQYWNPTTGVIFFYSGNEADVTLYVNHTGLMWENAQQFNALLVFAEHRYYGLSQPFGTASQNILQYLTHEQALADYAELLISLQTNLSITQPIIVFGGSYGGMLAAWARIKYPSIFTGAISASAPIMAFNGMIPAYNNNTYWQVVTNDATANAGSPAACANNVRAAFNAMLNAGNTPDGLTNLSTTFQMCTPLQSMTDVQTLALFHLNAWDTMAMGSYPYPSNYLTGGGPLLPPYPVNASCQYLSDPTLATGDIWKLLTQFNLAGNVFNNATLNIPCYTLPTDIWEDGIWDYQWCTELLPEETYFTTNGQTDMFYPRLFDLDFITNHCYDKYGIYPRPYWIRTAYGLQSNLGVGNIVFSNGELDPWSSGGVKVSTNPSVTILDIPMAGHHLDLFFTNPLDPPSLTQARQTEISMIRQWITEWYSTYNTTSKNEL